jgi:hypothetical protein
MQRLHLSAALFLLASCAHEQVVSAKVEGRLQGIEINAPGIVSLTQADVSALDSALRAKAPRSLKLSEEQKADCRDRSCAFQGRHLTGNLTHKDIRRFVTLLDKARLSRRQEILREGPLTWSCDPSRCAVDLHYRDESVHEISGDAQVKIQTSPAPYLAGIFLGSLLGAALVGSP